jgi:RNA polymerase sigma-70 factor (TIGR02943 family)
MSDFAAQLESLRPQLLRFARTQLRNEAWAEDAVSETLLAALERPHTFGGQSQLKTWLVGILKHKVIDQIRRHGREMSNSNEDEIDLDELLFAHNGSWQTAPRVWHSPEASLDQRQFFEVLEMCMELLPGQQGRIFMMREWLELDADEICKQLGISTTNLWVLLHRARLRLRACLEQRWFGATASQPT